MDRKLRCGVGALAILCFTVTRKTNKYLMKLQQKMYAVLHYIGREEKTHTKKKKENTAEWMWNAARVCVCVSVWEVVMCNLWKSTKDNKNKLETWILNTVCCIRILTVCKIGEFDMHISQHVVTQYPQLLSQRHLLLLSSSHTTIATTAVADAALIELRVSRVSLDTITYAH